jgi:HTH-type transcriptional regulator / antitoxin HigA
MEEGTMTVATDIFTLRYRQLMNKFPLRPILTKKDANAATEILDKLFPKDSYEDPGEEAYVIVLARLLADYEEKHEPPPDKLSGLRALQYLVDEHGIKQSELSKLLGISQAAVSMILRGERPITAEHARRLGKRFKLDPGTFL